MILGPDVINITLHDGTSPDFSETLPGCSDARKRLSADEACDHFALNGEIETSIRRRLGRLATSSASATSPASTVTAAAWSAVRGQEDTRLFGMHQILNQ